jgi:hypothetical protein
LTFTDGVAKLILIGLLEYFEWEVHFCRQGLILRSIRALAWWRLPHLVDLHEANIVATQYDGLLDRKAGSLTIC